MNSGKGIYKMKILPPELNIGDRDGFKPELDLFNRAHLGQRLTSLVTRVEDPMVLALDAPWGSGKTAFLRMWAGDLRNAGLPVVYFDAFSADHVDEPFVALSAEVIALARQKQAEEAPVEAFTDKALATTKMLAAGGLRLATKAAVRGATAGLLSAADLGEEFGGAIASDVAGLADKQIEGLLVGAQARRDTLEAFRTSLAALPKLLLDADNTPDALQAKQGPLIFIIDELDRCAPPFALGLLERMKHFFSVPNVQFVLGVHLEQLERSVRAAYGSDIDARTYLQKFVHFTVPLVDTARHPPEAVARKYITYLTQTLANSTAQPDLAQGLSEILGDYALRSKVSLRTIERIYSTLAVCLASMPRNSLAIAPLLAGLAILKTTEPSLYVAAKTGELQYEQIRELFGFKPSSDVADGEPDGWAESWWRYACDVNARDELIRDYAGRLVQYGIHSREDLLPVLVNDVLELFEFPEGAT